MFCDRCDQNLKPVAALPIVATMIITNERHWKTGIPNHGAPMRKMMKAGTHCNNDGVLVCICGIWLMHMGFYSTHGAPTIPTLGSAAGQRRQTVFPLQPTSQWSATTHLTNSFIYYRVIYQMVTACCYILIRSFLFYSLYTLWLLMCSLKFHSLYDYSMLHE